MLLGTVNTQALGGDLKLGGGVTKCHEREDPDQNADGIGGETLEGSDIHCLGARGVSLTWMTEATDARTNHAASFQSRRV